MVSQARSASVIGIAFFVMYCVWKVTVPLVHFRVSLKVIQWLKFKVLVGFKYTIIIGYAAHDHS